jgi:SAM-dependent methyltransferase/uncharacterized protein YbaR (Trm112 family)
VKEASFAMRCFQKLGMDSLAWSLRRLHCPVDRRAMVLEVGSGGNPYWRSNVLLDAYETTRERHWAPLVADRPTVLGFVESLPFRDKAFDFVIASHVLEHSTDPAKFLTELQRVAKAGYIEVPDAFMERINPYRDHRLEITTQRGELRIRKKEQWQVDPALVALYEARVKPFVTKELMRKRPFQFHVRFYWSDSIQYQILNPDVDARWPAPEETSSSVANGVRPAIYRAVLNAARSLLSQSARNKRIDLEDFLRCPACHSTEIKLSQHIAECKTCKVVYKRQNGVPALFPPKAMA